MEERLPSPPVVQTHQQQQPSRSRPLKPLTAMYSMRTAMPHFVGALRVADEWKRQHSKRAEAIAQAEYDVSAKFVKSAFARSANVEDLARFVDDTQLDIDFMMQLPSIEKCLEQWWHMYVHETKSVDQDLLRAVFYDLATVLVEAKTENIHKNSISMIVRGGWTKWGPKEPPLAKSEFFRLLFILAHLMTTSNRLNDYVVFLQETLARITRVHQSKVARTAIRQPRQPKSRRKFSIQEIMAGRRPGGPVIVPLALASQGSSGKSGGLLHGNDDEDATSGRGTTSGEGSLVSVKMNRIVKPHAAAGLLSMDSASGGGFFDDDLTEPLAADRFVEVLERNSRCQHIVVDPLLHDESFQRKWKRASGDATKSLNALAVEQNPVMSAFAPPMVISRLRASRSATTVGDLLRLSMDDGRGFASAANFTAGEEEILRRSLSRVTLKERVAHSKLASTSPLHRGNTIVSPLPGRPTARGSPDNGSNNKRDRDSNKQPLYLAIST